MTPIRRIGRGGPALSPLFEDTPRPERSVRVPLVDLSHGPALDVCVMAGRR